MYNKISELIEQNYSKFYERLEENYYKLYDLLKMSFYNLYDLIKESAIKKDILMALAVGLFGAAVFIVLVMSLPGMFLN